MYRQIMLKLIFFLEYQSRTFIIDMNPFTQYIPKKTRFSFKKNPNFVDLAVFRWNDYERNKFFSLINSKIWMKISMNNRWPLRTSNEYLQHTCLLGVWLTFLLCITQQSYLLFGPILPILTSCYFKGNAIIVQKTVVKKFLIIQIWAPD